MDLINPQFEPATIDQLRGQWLRMAGEAGQALERWRAAWLEYVSTGFQPPADRAAAREVQARAWTEYVAVSAQADRAWHDYDGAVDARGDRQTPAEHTWENCSHYWDHKSQVEHDRDCPAAPEGRGFDNPPPMTRDDVARLYDVPRDMLEDPPAAGHPPTWPGYIDNR